MQNVSFQDLVNLFPAVLAPALIARLRKRWPAIDGTIVWIAVVIAAVLFSIALAALFGQLPSLEIARRGMLLGILSASAHTLLKGDVKPAASVAVPINDAAPTEPNAGPPAVTVDLSREWGPNPSEPER